MDTRFKVPSNETENITASQNNLNFDIPEGVYNLKKSWLEYKMLVTGGSTGQANHAGAIFNIQGNLNIQHTHSVRYAEPVSLIKHARLTSDNLGNVEELRHVNLVRNMENTFLQHQDGVICGAYHNSMGIRRNEKFGSLSPLVEVSSESGTNTGRYIEKTVRVPLSKVLQVGSSELFDCNRLGKCRLHVEMDIGRLVPQADGYQPLYFTDKNHGFGNGLLKNISAAGPVTSAVLAASDNQANAKIYNEDYQDHIPYYVGMPIKVPASGGGNANNGTVDGAAIAADVFATITDIAYNPVNGNITLTFSNALFTVAAAGSVGVHIEPIADADVNNKAITVNQAKVTLHEVGAGNMPDSMPSALNYTKLVQEQDFGSGIAQFKRQYEMEPSAVNMLLLMKANHNDIVSENLFTKYRITVDNEATTDRDIFSNTPLSIQKLNMYSLNQAGKEIKNLAYKSLLRNQAIGDSRDETAGNDLGTTKVNSIIAEPLPITGKMKLVGLEIQSGGMNDFAIYKEVVASI
jgi:hypothetical protein